MRKHPEYYQNESNQEWQMQNNNLGDWKWDYIYVSERPDLRTDNNNYSDVPEN